MTEDQTVTPDVQAAINSLYRQGFEAGRAQGYAEGIAAARKHLTELTSPQLQEANASMPLGTPIERLGFSTRVYNGLKRKGVHTLGDLVGLSYMDLLDVRDLGVQSVMTIRSKVESIGYTLCKDPDYQ